MLKNISWRKLVGKFKWLEFDGPFSGGRHLFMTKGELKVHIPILTALIFQGILLRKS